jgi:hypothetical protein
VVKFKGVLPLLIYVFCALLVEYLYIVYPYRVYDLINTCLCGIVNV